MYKLNFKGLNNDWVEQLRDVELNELEWRDYVTGLRTVDATEYFHGTRFNQLNTENSVTADLVYPMINRNNTRAAAQKRPQLHLRSIFLAMFEKIGYSINSAFLDSDWVKGLNPPNTDYTDAFGNPYEHLGLSVDPVFQMTREQQDVIGELIEYSTTGITGTDPNTWADATVMGNRSDYPAINLRPLYRFPNIINTQITDNFGRFNTSTSEFTVGTSGTYVLEFDFEFEFAFWDLFLGFNWQPYTGKFDNTQHPPSFKWYVVKNNTSDTVIDGVKLFERSVINVGTGVDTNRSIQFIATDHVFSAGDKISVFLELLEDATGQVQGYLNSPPFLTVANIGAMRYWKMRIKNNSVLKVVPKEDVQIGDVFRINSHIPEGIKCMDLLQDFKTMFNLYFDVDLVTKTVFIEPRDDFYSGNLVDITDSIDLTTPPLLNYLSDYKNELVFEYATDSKDKYLEQWNKVNKKVYGQYKYLFNNNERFDKGQSVLKTSLISASIQGAMNNPINNPETTSLIKEEYLDADNVGKGVNQNYGARVFQLVRGKQFTTANASKGRIVNLVGIMENYANTPTFGDRKLTFIGEHGLVWDYYTKTIANIEDTVLLTIKMNMSLATFNSWDLKDTFYISEPAEIAGYYITDSIKNFNVTKETMTTVTLVKFKDFEPVAVTGGVGNVNVITQTPSQPQEIMCIVNGAIVSCLDNNLQKMYKI